MTDTNKDGADGVVSTNWLAAWPYDRRMELALLQELLREAQTINHGSNAVGRIVRCEEIARELTSLNLDVPRKSFWNFLLERAAGDPSANARDEQPAPTNRNDN